jgi:RNA polymerase sigma factor (sigma-70 family)
MGHAVSRAWLTARSCQKHGVPLLLWHCFQSAMSITERRNAVSHCTTISRNDASLFHQAQAGDAESLARLMDAHDSLVHYIVRRQWRGRLTYSEAVHEGRIGLWRAILGFDPQRGCAFSTYASVAIARQVWRAVAQVEKEARKCCSPLLPRLYPALIDNVLAWEAETVLQAMVERLPVKERLVVRVYYGLDGWGGCTLAKLGRRLGCTRQAVHYRLHKALVRLRHPAFSALLRALLGRNRREDYLRALRPERRQR